MLHLVIHNDVFFVKKKTSAEVQLIHKEQNLKQGPGIPDWNPKNQDPEN